VAEVASVAKAKIQAASDRAHAGHSIVEAQLKASLVPATPKNPAERQLARQAILGSLGERRALSAVPPMLALLTEGPDSDAVTAELYSDWGRSLLGADARNDPYPASQAWLRESVQTLLKQPRHARRALQIAGVSKARGSIDAARTAAQMRLK